MGTLELVGVTPKYLTTINRSSFETFGLGSQVPVRKVIRYIFPILYFVHPIFCYRFLVTFGDQVTKIRKILRNLSLHFASKDGQDGKKWNESHATKVTKIPNT